MSKISTVGDTQWEVFERSGEIEFRVGVRSPRLRSALADVWQSLPLTDRNSLNNSLAAITDNRVVVDLLHNERTLGIAVKPLDRWLIALDAMKLKNESPDHIRFVVAHEMAHVYHDHTGENIEQYEIEADATAARWGYPLPQ